MKSSRVVTVTVVAVIAIAMLLGTLIAALRKDELAPRGGEVVYDDFGFSVAESRSAASVAGGVRPEVPGDVFRVVSIEIKNHAQRVSFDTRTHRPVLIGADGTEYEVAQRAQQAMDAEPASGDACPAEIPAGASCVRDWVFETPAGVAGLTLRIAWGGPLVDRVDWVLLGDRRLIVQ